MIGFPDFDDLKYLIGSKITNLSFGPNIVYLYFDNEAKISIESEFFSLNRHIFRNGADRPVFAESVINARVKHLNLENDSMALLLDNGINIKLVDDSDMYDSVVFFKADGDIVV